MPSLAASVLTCLGALVLWGGMGYPLARRVLPATLAWPLAPALGWACHSVLALPLFEAAGMARWIVAAAFGVPLALGVAALTLSRSQAGHPGYSEDDGSNAQVPLLAYGLAALLAVAPALAVLPKAGSGTVSLAGPIFDHSKIALIDEIARAGVPPINPFFAEVGTTAKLAYYYLWHFSAAELAVLFGITGWAADAALSLFTAFTSLSAMAGLAVWVSGRPAAGFLVMPLSFAASLHPVLAYLFGPQAFYSTILPPSGLGGWLFQASWAPQHIAGATAAVLSSILLAQLACGPTILRAAILGLTFAAAYQTSIWVGGVVIGLAAPAMTLVLLASVARRGARLRMVFSAGLAAALALLLVFPFVQAQIVVAAAREVAHPIAFVPYEVFSYAVSDRLRPLANIAGFWLVLLPIEFPAIYLPGLLALVMGLTRSGGERVRCAAMRSLAVLLAASLGVTACLTTTFADNNDLGWRAVLPGVFTLTILAAGGMARWLAAPRKLLLVAMVLVLVTLSLPRSLEILEGNGRGRTTASDAIFAQSEALWAAVRSLSAPDERIANNPLYLENMTPWPVNISWALLADRRSCYAGHGLAVAFAPLSRTREEVIEGQFRRVFAGSPEPGDLHALARQFECSVAVITPQDGAWERDPFATSPDYRLVEEEPGRWRIYRATAALAGSG